VFTSYGITTIIVYGSIFESFREWIIRNSSFFGSLISCVLCTSTWVGFVLSIILGGLFEHTYETNWFFGVFLDGMFTAGSVWALNSIIEYFEENRPNRNEEIEG
jgi:MFS family permease